LFRSILNDENKTGVSFALQDKSGFKIEDEEFSCKEKYKRIIRSLHEATNFKDVIGHPTMRELLNSVNSALNDHFPPKNSGQDVIPETIAPDAEVFRDLQDEEEQEGEDHDDKREDDEKTFEILDLKIKLENQNKTIEVLAKENVSG
jgi:hypothetical protein